MAIDGGHIEWMGLYELDVSSERVQELVKEWNEALESGADDPDFMDPDFDQWVREHPAIDVKCVQLSFDPMDAYTGDYLNEITLP